MSKFEAHSRWRELARSHTTGLRLVQVCAPRYVLYDDTIDEVTSELGADPVAAHRAFADTVQEIRRDLRGTGTAPKEPTS